MKKSMTINLILCIGLLGIRHALAQQQEPTPERVAETIRLEETRRNQDTEKLATALKTPRTIQLADGFLGYLSHFTDDIVEGKPVKRPIYIGANMGRINKDAAITTRANRLYPGGGLFNLTGNNVTIGMWDDGIPTHLELVGRVSPLPTNTAVGTHATHVAGTLAAKGNNNPLAKGMAYDAKIRAGFMNYPYRYSEIATMASLIPPQQVPLSNHSYGEGIGWILTQNGWVWYGSQWVFGAYTMDSKMMDDISAVNKYHLIVKSAGNSRMSPAGQIQNGPNGYDTIPASSTAKNILTVGAVNDVPNYINPSSVALAAFSSCGPTDDGRIKPDIVANGVGVNSSIPNPTTPNYTNGIYGSYNGTSMASPNACGSAALLVQHLNYQFGNKIPNCFLKCLIIHTADEAGSIGPDYQYGWGLMNVERAATIYRWRQQGQKIVFPMPGNEPTTGYRVGILPQGGTHTITMTVKDVNRPIRATIVWNDPSPTNLSSGTLNPLGFMTLVNDLDLRILGPGNMLLPNNQSLPWVLNPSLPANPAGRGDNIRDNVEQVIINPTTPSGQYTIKITHKNNLKYGSQEYALVWENLYDPVVAIGIFNPVIGKERVEPPPHN
jgi:Subtilase family